MTSSNQVPLRIGLLVDSFSQPLWIHKVIVELMSSSIADVVLVVKNEAIDEETKFFKKLQNNRRELLYLLYCRLDSRLFASRPDAFKSVSIEGLVADCPTLRVNPLMKKYSDYLQEQDIEAILEYDLDVALRFGFRILRGPVLQIAKYGVWSYHHGDNLVNRGGPAGFWEVMQGNPITGSVLQILSEDLDDGQVIYRSYAATHQYSLVRNRNSYYWKSSAFVLRKLRDLYEHGQSALDSDPLSSTYQPYSYRLYRKPGNSEMFRLVLGLLIRYASIKTRSLLFFEQWFLAYEVGKPATADATFHKFKSIVPPKGRFWADPFPVKKGERFYIFIEEFIEADGKGHISVIEMDSGGRYGDAIQVLEREYHLSYPFIFEWRGNYYMIPETAANKTIELYRCKAFPDSWELEEVLMEDVNAVDTTLAELNGLWWMFVNIAPDGASIDDELHLFYADNPFGPWKPHELNPVVSDVRRSRPAGRLFQNGAIYRPAQDCSRRYGYAISINKIDSLSPTDYQETEVSKIMPKWRDDITGTHTLNSSHELTVIDGVVQRRRFF